MIADYFFIRRQTLIPDDLYRHHGAYYYRNGFNIAAIIALLAGVLPNVPGFLLQIKVIGADNFPYWINDLYHYAWFVGFFLSGILYYWLMKRKK